MTNKEPVVLETVSETWLVTAGSDGQSSTLVSGFEAMKDEVIRCMWPDMDGGEEADGMRAEMDDTEFWDGDHWSCGWSFEDGYINVQRVLASRLAIQAPATLDEWGEEDGDVVWWCWRNGEWLGESPYIGSPLDLGQTVEIELRTNQGEFVHRHDVGGWPGYHTHWTPRPALPAAPNLGATK